MSQYDQLMAGLPPQPLPPRAAEIPRTWWEVGKDTLAALERGSAHLSQGMVGLPVDAVNFVNQFSPANLPPASWGLRPGVLSQPQAVRELQTTFREDSQHNQDLLLSEKARRQIEEFDQTIGFRDAANYAVTNPSFLGMAAVEQVPQLAMAIPGRIQATIALQSGLAGSMNASQTSAELAPRVTAGEMTQQDADRRSATVFTGTFALNAGTSLLPGAQTLERLAAGQATWLPAGRTAAHIATSIAGEAAQGGLAEAGEQILQNLATDQPWNQDTGKVAALGAMLEGPLGGAGRGVEVMVSRRSDHPPIQPTLAIEPGLPKIAPILQSEGFRRWYGERSIEQLEKDYAELDGTDGGRRLDVDLVRELAPDYVADRSRASEVHEYASALTKELFARALAKPPSPDRSPVVAFLAGGGGSGKSTAGGPIIEELNPDLIVDGTLSNLTRAHRDIEASLASNRDVNVIYVYRSPEKSVEGAIERAISEGRPVPVDALAEAHANAAKTVKALTQAYNDNGRVEIDTIWNDGELENRRSIPIEEVPDVNQQHAEHIFYNAVESANSAGKLSPRLYAAFSGRLGVQSQNRIYPDPGSAIEAVDEKGSGKTKQTNPGNTARNPVAEPINDTLQEPESPDTGEHTETASEPETGPAQEAPHAAEPIHAAPASEPTPPVAGTITAASPQPAQAIDPQQQRQIQAEAFKQDPALAAETFPGLAAAHNTYQAVATRAANMRSPQRRNNLLSLLKNKLAHRIQHGQHIPSPKQAVTWASNLVNGRSHGD